MKHVAFIWSMCAFLMIGGVAFALPDVVVVGNPSNGNVLTKDQIVNIFLSKMREFPDGMPVKPVDQVEGRQPREEFVTKILDKTEFQLKSYWSNLIFTGNGSPPAELNDDEAVKKFVRSNPRAIGYIDSRSVDSSVRVIFTK